MKIGFVVLCYGNYPMVDDCLNHLLKLHELNSTEIIVIDNASPDGTGEKIKKNFGVYSNFHIIMNSENQGFARGNNIGYKQAIQYGCDTVVVMNSDVLIEDVEFISKLKQTVSENNKVAIIAPDILGIENRHTNPYRTSILSKNEAKKRLIIKRILYALLKICVKYKTNNTPIINNCDKPQQIQYNVGAHGACVIFCPNWVKHEKYAFYSKTFLYHEEFFLHYYAEKKNYITAYIPSICVRHIGDASLDNAHQVERKKKMFTLKCQIDSLRQYIAFIDNYDEKWNC